MTWFKQIAFWPILILLSLCVGSLVSRQAIQFNHTLAQHPQLLSSKLLPINGLSSACAFSHTRLALAKDKLNLGVWHGHHEIFLNDYFNFKTLKLDLEGSYGAMIFYLLFESRDHKRFGIRLSQAKDLPSLFFTLKDNGEFINKTSFPLPLLIQGPMVVKILREQGQARLAVGDKFSIPLPFHEAGELKVGLASGTESNLYVDNFILQDIADKLIFAETFSPPRPKTSTVLLISLLIIFANLGLFYLCKKTKLPHPQGQVIYLNIFILVFLFAFNFYDRYYLMEKRPQEMGYYPGCDSKLEGPEEQKVRVAQEIQSVRTVPGRKVIFLGSSQLWGSGASVKERQGFELIKKQLQQENKTSCFQLINGAMNGSDMHSIPNLYQQQFSSLKIDLVFLFLGHNDLYNQQFIQELQAFIKVLNHNSQKLVLVSEPMFQEQLLAQIWTYEALKWVAESEGVPFLDLSPFFSSKNSDIGILWWDEVHLRDLGHQKLAETFLKLAEPFLKCQNFRQ